MLKRQGLYPGDVPPQGQRVHEKDAGFEARESVSDCIERATLVFEKHLESYWAIQAELDRRFDEMAASDDANMTDLMMIIGLLIRTTDAGIKIVEALAKLAGISYSRVRS